MYRRLNRLSVLSRSRTSALRSCYSTTPASGEGEDNPNVIKVPRRKNITFQKMQEKIYDEAIKQYRKEAIKTFKLEEEKDKAAHRIAYYKWLREKQEKEKLRLQLKEKRVNEHNLRQQTIRLKQEERRRMTLNYNKHMDTLKKAAALNWLKELQETTTCWQKHPDEMRNKRYLTHDGKQWYNKYN